MILKKTTSAQGRIKVAGLILALLFILSGLTGLRANVRDSIRLENFIQRQIEGYLSRVLPGNSYLITVSVDAEMVRTQEVKNETVNEYLKEESSGAPKAPETPQAPRVENQVNQTPQEPLFEILPGLEKIFNFDPDAQVNTPPQPIRPQPVPVPNQIPERNFREESNNTQREYTYTDTLNIREVSAQIAFDDSLNPALVQSVKNMIGSKMDVTFGDKATVIFTTVNLDQVRQEPPAPDVVEPPPFEPVAQPETPLEEAMPPVTTDPTNNSLIEYYLDKYSSVFYLLLSVFIFILLLFIFIFFLWLFLRMYGKKERKTEKIDPPPPSPSPLSSFMNESAIPITLGGSRRDDSGWERQDDRQSPPSASKREAMLGNREERFLDQFLKEPLLSRKYFQNLPDEDKNELLSAFVSNAIKLVFRDIANNQALGQETLFENKDIPLEELEKIRDSIFSKHIKGIEQYSKIYGPQMRDPFSKLAFFTEEELKTLFNGFGIKSASILAKNVDSEKMVPYLNQLSDDKRKEFLEAFNQEADFDSKEIERIRDELREKSEALSRNIFIRKADNQFIKRKLLESSRDKKKFLEGIRSEDPDLYDQYRNYTVDFNDFMADSGSVFNRTIQIAENEDLTLVLIGAKNPEFRNRVLAALPQIRKEFISSYANSRQNSANKEEIEAAKDNILSIYRNFLI